jgi:hypothetical protein
MKNALAGFALLIAISAAHADEWIYSSISDLTGKQIVIATDSIGGHGKAKATMCPESAPYICYSSTVFNFAFPRADQDSVAWTQRGFAYRVTKRETMSLLGMQIDLIEIEQSRQGKKVMKFFFSKKRGIISFRAAQKGAPVFLLENACGLGAAAECQAKP